MKALILYFSGTGNTKFLANKIKKQLEENEIEVTMQSTEKKLTQPMQAYDYLFLGTPKYYEYPALPLIWFINNKLKKTTKPLPVFVFCTQASFTKTSFGEIARKLKQKNYLLTMGKSYAIASNMVIFQATKPAEEEKIKENIQQTLLHLQTDVKNFLAQKIEIEKPSKVQAAVGYVSGHVFTKIFPIFMMHYQVDQKSCIQCKKCVQQCPVHNIKMQQGYPKFYKKCIFCMRCINECPVNAIRYKNNKCEQYKVKKLDEIG